MNFAETKAMMVEGGRKLGNVSRYLSLEASCVCEWESLPTLCLQPTHWEQEFGGSWCVSCTPCVNCRGFNPYFIGDATAHNAWWWRRWVPTPQQTGFKAVGVMFASYFQPYSMWSWHHGARDHLGGVTPKACETSCSLGSQMSVGRNWFGVGVG